MVYINSQKFACESCIKGHRSSSCAHTDRPLYEIKKKGRPVSQCERCRELRSTKRVHSKCTCSDARTSRSHEAEKSFGTKQKRYIPIVPALPNGLKDALAPSSRPVRPPDPRQRVDSLLNPCPCEDVWNCQCRASTSAAATAALDRGAPTNGLATLARAAALCCVTDSTSPPPPTPSQSTPGAASPALKHPRAPTPTASPTQSPRALPCSHPRAQPKRAKRTQSPEREHERGPALPPLLFPPAASPSMPAFPFSPPHLHPPAHAPMPPFSAFTRLAGSGCTCGLRCACPDCAEHRGADDAQPEEEHGVGAAFEAAISGHGAAGAGVSRGHKHAASVGAREDGRGHSHVRRDCGDGCGNCVDEDVMALDLSKVSFGLGAERGFAAAGTAPRGAVLGQTVLDRFFAQAARIPLPGADVELPKLCCGGACACGGACGCGGSCQGCCEEEDDNEGAEEQRGGAAAPRERAEAAAAGCCG